MSQIIYLDEPGYLPDHVHAQLAALGDFQVFDDRPTEDEAIDRLRKADVAIVEWTKLSDRTFVDPGKLHDLVLVTTGYSYIDVKAARQAGVNVSNTPEYSRQSVAEHLFGLVLACAKRIPSAARLAAGSSGAKYTDHEIGVELFGHTLGVLGLGNIGTWVAKLGHGFGMNVVAYNRSRVRMPDVTQLDLDDVLSVSDVIAVCLPHSEDVAGLINRERVALLKSRCILVNISGNDCLDENALAEALSGDRLYGVGLDEPTTGALASAPHVIMTPGTAWYTQASLDRNMEMVAESVRLALLGKPRFVVN